MHAALGHGEGILCPIGVAARCFRSNTLLGEHCPGGVDELDRDPLGDSVILTLSSRKLDLVDPLCELSRINVFSDVGNPLVVERARVVAIGVPAS